MAAWVSYELAVTTHDRVAAESTPAGQRVHARPPALVSPRSTWRLADPRSAPLETESEAPLAAPARTPRVVRGVAAAGPRAEGRAPRVIPLPAGRGRRVGASGRPVGAAVCAPRPSGKATAAATRRGCPGWMTARRNHRPGRVCRRVQKLPCPARAPAPRLRRSG